MVNLINHELSRKYQHVIICITEAGSFSRRIEVEDVRITEIHKQAGKDLMSYWRMWKAIRRLRPNIVHTRNANAIEYQLVAALAGVRHRIHGEHGWDTHDLYGQNKKYRLMRKLLNPLISQFLTVSKDLENYLVRTVGIPQTKVTQIYNGVDTKKFRPGGKVRNLAHWKHRSDSEFVVIGTVGRLYEVKKSWFPIAGIFENS